MKIILVGNPNGGKTTLFNALTGAKQHVGNWPGVTVERKTGMFILQDITVNVVDLPGLYSVIQTSDTSAIDEKIAADCILEKTATVVVNIVDACHLERHLYLTTQLIEMGIPFILALNMMDVALDKNIQIDIKQLSRILNCPVIALNASEGHGVNELKQMIIAYEQPAKQQQAIPHHAAILQAIHALNLPDSSLALRLLEGDIAATRLVSADSLQQVKEQEVHIQAVTGEDADILLADARYRFIEMIMQTCVSRSTMIKTTMTSRIDTIVLNRVLGIPIFLLMMYLLFVFAINVGGFLQDYVDAASQKVFVEDAAFWLNHWHAPMWLTALLANGIGKGINTTLTFIPVIGCLFLFLALLEDSGYMARAAFVIDRFMRALGLPGKAFVPMIVGFGCNVPAVMGARTLENKRDRILTIMMTPFMSCGARLAIFAVFATAFFPAYGQNIVFALYLIGIFMAILTGFLLRTTLLQGEPSPLVMELPSYHMPRVKTVCLHAWQRLKGFVFRAGGLIIPICVLLGALNTLNVDGTLNTGEGDAHSLLSIVGQFVTPIFAPMGIHADNWPATVGLMTGVLAKEVVIGTLNTLYSQIGQVADTYGIMYQHFDGQIGAFAYLLFVLLYFPCVSTMAVMMRELHRGWSVFSALWMMGVAYGTAVTFYQAATFFRHPLSSFIWIVAITVLFFATIAAGRWYAASESLLLKPAGETT